MRTGVTMGPYANAMLADLNVHTAIMSVAAINEKGFFNSNILQVETQRAMLGAGDQVIVVADSTKFGRSSLARLCELRDATHVVVDEGIEKRWTDALTKAGVKVSVAEAIDEVEKK